MNSTLLAAMDPGNERMGVSKNNEKSERIKPTALGLVQDKD